MPTLHGDKYHVSAWFEDYGTGNEYACFNVRFKGTECWQIPDIIGASFTRGKTLRSDYPLSPYLRRRVRDALDRARREAEAG